jgi:hypothetical protein
MICHIRQSLQKAKLNISKEVISEEYESLHSSYLGKWGIMNDCPGGHERPWPENDSPWEMS